MALATRCYLRAAEQALRGDDTEAAIVRALRGVTCGASGEELGAIRLIEAEAHNWRGDFALAEERALEAVTLLVPGTRAYFQAVVEIVLASGQIGAIDRVERWSRASSIPALSPGAL